MRRSATLTTVTMLLGGCAGYVPPQPAAPPTPAPVVAAPAAAEAPPRQPAPQPRDAAPRRPQAVRIDNTSLESFRASWERLHASLSPAQRADLNDAVVQLTFARYGNATGLPANLRSSPIVPEMVRNQIAGLTYAEIVALAP